MTPIAGGVQGLEGAPSFADDAVAEGHGLVKPQATIIAKGKAGPPARVKVGDETKDKQSYFVQARQAARRLPGAQVVRRPHLGQGRRPQEGPTAAAVAQAPVGCPSRPGTRTAPARASVGRLSYLSPLSTLPPCRGQGLSVLGASRRGRPTYR